jgi:hypothetical protein
VISRPPWPTERLEIFATQVVLAYFLHFKM